MATLVCTEVFKLFLFFFLNFDLRMCKYMVIRKFILDVNNIQNSFYSEQKYHAQQCNWYNINVDNFLH